MSTIDYADRFKSTVWGKNTKWQDLLDRKPLAWDDGTIRKLQEACLELGVTKYHAADADQMVTICEAIGFVAEFHGEAEDLLLNKCLYGIKQYINTDKISELKVVEDDTLRETSYRWGKKNLGPERPWQQTALITAYRERRREAGEQVDEDNIGELVEEEEGFGDLQQREVEQQTADTGNLAGGVQARRATSGGLGGKGHNVDRNDGAWRDHEVRRERLVRDVARLSNQVAEMSLHFQEIDKA